MINLNTKYGSVAAPTSGNYPSGGPQNSTSPGALDGFPLEEAWLQDKEGFFQTLIAETGISISGNADTVLISDSFDALSQIIVADILVTGTGSINMANYSGSSKLLILSNSSGGDITFAINDVPSGNYEQAPILEFFNFGGNLLKIQAKGIGGIGTEFILYSNTYLRFFWDDVNNTYRLIDTSTQNRRIDTDITIDFTVQASATKYLHIQRYYINSGINGVYTTLKDASTCQGKKFFFMKTDSNSSSVTLKPVSSQTINGMDYVFLIHQYQFIIIESDGADYKIVGGQIQADSGLVNTSDWTNRHQGTIDLIVVNSAGYEIGETVQEDVSNFTGVVVSILGNILKLWVVTGGFFTDTRNINGLKSTTVSAVNGNTKNLDTNFYHGFILDYFKLNLKYNIYDDLIANNYNSILSVAFDASSPVATNYGVSGIAVDTNNVQFQTGLSGVARVATNGNVGGLVANDFYYRNLVNKLF